MNTNRQISILKRPALLAFLTVFFVVQLSSKTELNGIDFEKFKGLWLTEIDNEAIYLLIKKNHLASYIYKDRLDNKVYKGNWKLTNENIISVSGFDFKDSKFYIAGIDSELTDFINGDKNISTLSKVSKEILGVWAMPPDFEAPQNQHMPSTYFGLWETQDLNELKVIKIHNDRTVISIIKQDSSVSPHLPLQGEWYKHGQQLHIAWEDGSYSIIDNRAKDRVKLFDFAPGEIINEEASNYKIIKQNQSDKAISDWSKNQESLEKLSKISLSHLSYKSLLKFYRGKWITFNETQPNTIDVIKFNRFGGVNLASKSKINGTWYLQGKRCLINLEGGIRMQLKYIGSAFLVFVYEANRPLDGFPNKILKTAPLDTEKLNMLNNEAYFTLRLLNQVDHSNLRGKKLSNLISNLSGKDGIDNTPSSPWWWPIWSDNPKIEERNSFSLNNLSPPLTNDTDSIASSTETKQTNLPDPIDEINKSKWEWPF